MIPSTTADLPLHEQLYRAVRYVLDRSQRDPDLGYYIGPGTQAFKELCQAEAAYTGKPLAEIEEARGTDLQPEYRKRAPEVVTARYERDLARRASERGQDWRQAS